jgi:hypothetical protein
MNEFITKVPHFNGNIRVFSTQVIRQLKTTKPRDDSNDGDDGDSDDDNDDADDDGDDVVLVVMILYCYIEISI